MTTFRTHPDHAVVLFDAELTWAAATDLVDVVDLMVHGYFYRRIEIVIASNGGLTLALDHYLAALQRWRAAGVRVTTRVISRAQSAAAMMLSLSDERTAEPSARLLYHQARSFTSEPLTASGTAVLHDDLSRLETHHIDLLVDRAFGADPSLIAESDHCDRRVLELLGPRLQSGGARPPQSARGALRLLARQVHRAVRAHDRVALGTIYRELFALELPISGRLACTLRLLDTVVSPAAVADLAPRPPAACRDPISGRPGSFPESDSVPDPAEAWLRIPQWHPLFPFRGDVPRALLGRHFLALGETGSGKSVSVVLPVVSAIVAAPPDRVSASLVIDPKHEIGPMLERLVPERLHYLRPADVGLSLMAGPRWSLEADLAAGKWLGAATKIMLRVLSFIPTSPARVLIDHQQDSLNAEFFAREGTSLLLTVLAFVLMLTKPGAPPPEDWLAGDSKALLWVRALLERANGGPDARAPNALALAAYALQGPLVEPPKAKPASVFDDNPFDDNPVAQAEEWLFARIARGARKVWGTGEGCDVIERVLSYWLPMVAIRPQFVGVLATARAACSDFAEPHVARSVYFGCEPGARDVGGGACDFAEAVGPDGGGRVLLFQPSRDGLDVLVTRVLKALFFEAVFSDPIRASGGPDLPLVAYVADEFHQFVTSDRVHGEANFVDACRSYGVFCVLACQSVSSIENAFAHSGGSEAQDATAVSILWNNTGSKFFFRSTDPRTASRVEELCPYRPGLSPVTQVRPLSTLSPGECYAALADGRFERRQLEPVLPRAVERAPALRLVPAHPDLQP